MSLDPAFLIRQLEWRYATKRFDPARRIPAETWAALERSLVLSPSAYGLQPWRAVVVMDPELRIRLRAASFNQEQVEACSHLVVFAAKERITAADLDRFLARVSEVRGASPESLASYRAVMARDLVEGPRAAWAAHWAARQAYLALGQFLASCAMLGIDACPMEGLDPVRYDALLGLEGSGYHTVCICAAGYRAEDPYAALPKVRFPAEELILRR